MASKRLGRGLDFLLSTPDEEVEAGAGHPEELDVTSISSNPWQPRTEFREEALEELSRSIQKLGVVQPIVVRAKGGGGFELIAGERRLLASKRAGLTTIPAIVREVNDDQMLTMALVENIQRQDLDPVERARAFSRLIEEQGLSHQQVAEVAGLARSTVSNALRLLELSDDMLAAVEGGQITEGHARTLLSQSDPEKRQELFQELLGGDLSVRSAEDKSRDLSGDATRKGTKSSEARQLERRLSDHLALKTVIKEQGQRGKVVIHYRNLEEFDRLYQKLSGEAPDV